ncbi:hypothetical protein VTO73DRAFT_79 [Trametes versicolor]
MYAGLVQNLTMFSHIKTSPDYLYVSPDMWRQLLPPHGPVFTNLRNLVFSLSWKHQEEDAIPLHCLLGPNLESLCLHFNCGDLPFEDQLHDAESGASVAAMSVTDLLAHLPQMSPRLRELQLFLDPSTTVHILGDCYASLDDDALADMARAWPYIETLMLCPSRSFGEPHPMPAAVTLAGLRDVVEQCPHLQILYVALADVKRAVCEELLARRPPPACGDGTHEASQVFKLGIGTPSIEPQDVAAVAAVLTMIFPARDFWIYVPWSIFNDIGASPGRWWYKVDRASLAFQLVRQQEQKHALERARVARPALRNTL